MGNVIFYELVDPDNKLKAETKDKIWSVDEYVRVELDRIYPHYHPIEGESKPKNLSMIRRWLERECQGEVIVKQYMAGGSLHIFGYFELEEDAVRCKLTWCGEHE